MKQIKTMLLGIAIILFGIACRIMGIGYESPTLIEWLGNGLPFIGIIITVVAFFINEN